MCVLICVWPRLGQMYSYLYSSTFVQYLPQAWFDCLAYESFNIITEKRLDNFYIRFGENNTLSEVLPDLHAKKFEGTICRNVTTSQPSGKRKLYYCNEKVYTSYMVIHRWDKQTSILTLCEVEVLYEEGKLIGLLKSCHPSYKPIIRRELWCRLQK